MHRDYEIILFDHFAKPLLILSFVLGITQSNAGISAHLLY